MINPGYKFAMSQKKVFATRGIRDSRIAKVFQLMLYGCPIKLEDRVYELVETELGGFIPIVVVDDKDRLVMGLPDMSIQNFSEMIAEMPKEEYEAWVGMHEGAKNMWDAIEASAKKRKEVIL